jgi:UDP-glucose 4-epimerase
MIVFQNRPQPGESGKIVVLFGVGLIGVAICKSLNRHEKFTSSYFPFHWSDPVQCKQDSTEIYNHLASVLDSRPKKSFLPSRIAFVWSAGAAGFSATRQNVADELVNFEIVLDLARKAASSFSDSKIFFHLVSSAGGLFENKQFVDEETIPEPGRYYGRLKFEQEIRLINLDNRFVKKIYRPTSAFGFAGLGHRMGLIPTLILNGFQNRVSTIFGGLSTLRDYVYNEDIGEYLEKKLFIGSTTNPATVYFLATGKPSSIYEIRHIVERAIGKKIFLRFHVTPETENSADIAVNSSALPADWSPTDLKIGIRHVLEDMSLGKTFELPLLQSYQGS